MPRFQKVLPIDFFLFRHGESEGNRANALSRQNDDHCFTKEFRERPSSTWRLTEKGMDQARAAGQWFLQNVKIKISRFYSSEYVRAMQTAGLLGIPNARWSTKILMRERDRGLQDVLPQKELQERFPHSSEWKERDPYLWTPEGGENIGSVELRFRLVLDTLSREAGRKAVLVVCHGEFMWAARKVLEGLFIEEFAELQR